MEKSILTIALALISAVTIAQNNLTPGQNGKIPEIIKQVKAEKLAKQPSLATKDTVKIDKTLHFEITKQTAIEMLPGLQGAYTGVTRAKNISAEQADDAKMVSGYFLRLIYQAWPDLALKQPAN